MSWVDDKLTEQFYRWELRGRGWHVCEHPVSIEPVFRPFTGHFVPPRPQRDDGRRHTFLSGLMERVGKSLSEEETDDGDVATGAEEEEPMPEFWEREEPVESQIILPRDRKYPRESFESLLLSLSSCEEPLVFEILGTKQETVIQFASSVRDASLLRRQVQGRFAGVAVHPSESALHHTWSEGAPSYAVVEFALEREFMLMLDAGGRWQAGLFAALSELAEGELGLLQVIFQPVRHSWAQSGLIAVTDGEGGPFFANRPELVKQAMEKFSDPLFAVVLRMAASADDADRAWQIIAEMAGGFGSMARPGGNNFVPLSNDDYDAPDHEEDLMRRQSRRAGMLLNLEELVSLVHFPDASIHAPNLRQDTGRTRALPSTARDGSIVLGDNIHAGLVQPVILSVEQRVRHVHVMGASGTGKSTLLFNLIRQDIENGEGVAVLDPHGDLIEQVLGIIPENRIGDVVLVDPSDEAYSVGFNILSAHSDFEKTLLASDLVSIFQRLSTSWGDQMGSVLNNAILAFLESSAGGTLADLRRFLLDSAWRKEFLRTVQDPDMVYYWEKGFPQLGGNKSIGPVLTRLETFLAPKPIRYMVSQRENKLDFADITDSGKILLAKLSQGQMGRENAWLLGSLLVSKLQQTVMARQRMRVEERRPFWFYIDEFHHFITPSMAEILSGARKYRMGLTLAHQDLAQLKRQEEVASAVLANAATRIVFRVSEADARSLDGGFAHFEARELQNLDIGEAICRIERSDLDFNLRVPEPVPLDAAAIALRRDEVIAVSRRHYARARDEVAAELARAVPERSHPEENPPAPVEPEPPAAMVPSEIRSQLSALREQLQKVSLPPVPSPLPVEQPIEETESLSAISVDNPPQPKPYEPTAVRLDVEQMGRGGDLHKAAQIELKQIAEAHGFRATIERQLPDSLETVDLYLQRDNTEIGCEISVSNTLDYELRNVAKILRAGIPVVAMIALDAAKLAKLESAIRNTLPTDDNAKVRCFLKPQFVEFIQSLVVETPQLPKRDGSKKVKGWKVKRTTVEISAEELQQRQAELAATMADSARREKARKRKS